MTLPDKQIRHYFPEQPDQLIADGQQSGAESSGFSYTKSIKGFRQRGYLVVTTDSDGKERNQCQKRIQGVNTRAFCLNTPSPRQNSMRMIFRERLRSHCILIVNTAEPYGSAMLSTKVIRTAAHPIYTNMT